MYWPSYIPKCFTHVCWDLPNSCGCACVTGCHRGRCADPKGLDVQVLTSSRPGCRTLQVPSCVEILCVLACLKRPLNCFPAFCFSSLAVLACYCSLLKQAGLLACSRARVLASVLPCFLSCLSLCLSLSLACVSPVLDFVWFFVRVSSSCHRHHSCSNVYVCRRAMLLSSACWGCK